MNSYPPSGVVIPYSLAPGVTAIPRGYAFVDKHEATMMPEGDREEGINPYQPDLFRVVMLRKL